MKTRLAVLPAALLAVLAVALAYGGEVAFLGADTNDSSGDARSEADAW